MEVTMLMIFIVLWVLLALYLACSYRKPLVARIQQLWGVARAVGAAPYNLDPPLRRWSVRAWLALSLAVVVWVVYRIHGIARRLLDPGDPLYDDMVHARAALARLPLAPLVVVLGAILGMLLFLVLENTEVGKRYLTWAGTDLPEVRAAKTRNAGSLLAILLGTCILAFALGVMR